MPYKRLLSCFLVFNVLMCFAVILANWKLAHTQIQMIEEQQAVRDALQEKCDALSRSLNVKDLQDGFKAITHLIKADAIRHDADLDEMAKYLVHLQIHYLVAYSLLNLIFMYFLRKSFREQRKRVGPGC